MARKIIRYVKCESEAAAEVQCQERHLEDFNKFHNRERTTFFFYRNGSGSAQDLFSAFHYHSVMECPVASVVTAYELNLAGVSQ